MSRLLIYAARSGFGKFEQKIFSLQRQQCLSFNKIRNFSCHRNNNLWQQRKTSLTEASQQSVPSTSVKQKVKETTATAWYTSVIIAGVGVTAFILYYVLNELFSKDSVNNIYSAALNRCLKEPKIVDLLGSPIKGFGEETRRGRRQHVSHLIYERSGINYIRMKFYLKGSRKEATVHLEMKQNVETGHYEYRYLFVQTDDYNRNIVILEDNRAAMDQTEADQNKPINPLHPLPPLDSHHNSLHSN